MKKLILLALTMTIQFNVAQAVDIWTVAKHIGDYQCGKGFDKNSFATNFESLFSSVYLNEDMSLMKPVMVEVDNRSQAACDEKGYFAFETQECYHTCQRAFKIGTWDMNAKLKRRQQPMCFATCTAINNREVQIFEDVNSILDSLQNDAKKDSKK